MDKVRELDCSPDVAINYILDDYRKIRTNGCDDDEMDNFTKQLQDK